MSEYTESSNLQGLKLQHTFVAMLFALVAASVASSAADVFAMVLAPGPTESVAPAIAHIVLSLIVVSMSWIEWSRATARFGNASASRDSPSGSLFAAAS